MAFALNVSVLYFACVAYKNLLVNPLKHDIHKNITPKFSSYVTVNFSIINNIVNPFQPSCSSSQHTVLTFLCTAVYAGHPTYEPSGKFLRVLWAHRHVPVTAMCRVSQEG